MGNPNNNRSPNIVGLEQRILFSANPLVSLEAGILAVEGTDQADMVQVSEVNGSIMVRTSVGDDQQEFKFDKAEVESLFFAGGDGDDTFINNSDLESLAYGNEGNDTLVGGFAMDELRGGNGDDLLNGRRGDDSLHGDYGNDRLVGQQGR